MVIKGAIALAALLGTAVAPARAAESPAPAARVLLVGLNVSDLQRSIDFYAKVLGMHETRRFTFGQNAEVLMGYGGPNETSVVLVYDHEHQGSYDVGAGFSRVGVTVPDVRAVVAATRAAGYKVVMEPKAFQGGGSILGMIVDPDGYRIELVQMTGPT
jgi:lactoylglutathione lyase